MTLYTPSQLAELLSITPDRLRQWRNDSRGPKYVKVGKAVRYRASDVEEWLDEQTIDPARSHLRVVKAVR